MKYPLLIADIDGVVASLKAVFLHPKHVYMPGAIEQLNKFCEETGAMIAPISARLRVQSAEYFRKSMRDAGFTGKFHPRIAVPRSLRPFMRGADLARFMEEEQIPLEATVIADDRPRFYTSTQISRLVQPQTDIGFTEENRNQAVQLLNVGTSRFPWRHSLGQGQTLSVSADIAERSFATELIVPTTTKEYLPVATSTGARPMERPNEWGARVLNASTNPIDGFRR